jgi:hypothetical protein
MSSVTHNDIEERPSERRERKKKERDPNRPRKPKLIDPETGEPIRSSHRRRKDKDKVREVVSEPNKPMIDVVPELARTASAPGSVSRSSLPYPSFSKAHSKEAVHSKEDISTRPQEGPKPGLYTPESTDIGSDDKPRAKSMDEAGVGTRRDERPPSPPDTEFTQQRKGTPGRTTQIREDNEVQSRPNSQASQRSWFGRTSSVNRDGSKVSAKSKTSKTSKASTAVRTKAKPASVEIVDDAESNISDERSGFDSNATSVAPKRDQPPVSKTPGLDTYSSPESGQDSSPRTPTGTPHYPDFKPTPSPFVSFDLPQDEAYDSPQPPPPPPPPMVPINVPRVDYLMQNGGLSRTIPKQLVAVTPSHSVANAGGRPTAPAPADVEKVFGPFYNLLDQYETVLGKNGSVAVATGYRSVARRLLDRLENVFARDLSSEGCFCVVCQETEGVPEEGNKGLGWGEVLEWVSGRRDLPLWPAFDFSAVGLKADGLGDIGATGHVRRGSGSGRPGSPVQMDPDIAEEFREHYLRQSKKTKKAVDQWLSATPATAAAPPPDVDDETLTFTILTHLDQHERPLFNALMTGSARPVQSASRAPTPLGKPRIDFVVKTGLAIQRLYRLPQPPRDPEACVYLLKNPRVHNLLATLSGINPSEWEILTSGRFDGFLWSGAESEFPGSMVGSPAVSRNPTPAMNVPSRGPTPGGRQSSFSRNAGTPFSMRNQTFSPSLSGLPSRGPTPMAPMPTGTPAQGGRGPVSNDEETEIAVLAEVEREIYAGMEALEDAFEALHRKAEWVRRSLRERGAGLSMASQSRRTSDPNAFARLGTPGMVNSHDKGWSQSESEVDTESEWGADEVSELAPDDSASNISSSRHRRPKRRNERRTPAPVEEEDEGLEQGNLGRR